MITIIGTRHVEDVKEDVRKIILERKPSAVCVEIAEPEYDAIERGRAKEASNYYRHKIKETPACKRGLRIQSRLYAYQAMSGKKTGVLKPGEELTTAVKIAEEINATVIPIDMKQSEIAKRIGETISLKERINIFLGCLKGRLLSKKHIKRKREECEREDYEEKFSREYPTLKQILIDERNKYMAEKIRVTCKKHENIVVVVGNAHIDGIGKLLSDLDIEIVKLRDLRRV